MTRLVLFACVLLAAIAVCGSPTAGADDTCPTYNTPNELVLSGGTPQSAKLGTAFQTSLAVEAENTNGCPITTGLAGLAVTFAAPASGPSGTFATSGSNAVLVGTGPDGSATAPAFTADDLPGGYQVVASSQFGSVSFSLVNTASGVPATVSERSPARQSATVARAYAQPLEVQVLDATGMPVQGVPVAFAFGSSAGGGSGTGSSTAGASFPGGSPQATATTDGAGIATSPAFTADDVAGTFTATATVDGVNRVSSFRLDNLAGTAPAISLARGLAHSASVGDRFAKPLEARVLGAGGAPASGVSVTFALGVAGGGTGASGASAAGATFPGGASQATALTNAHGVATSPRFVANDVAGSFAATASTTIAVKPAVASFRNLAGRPATITAGVAANESTSVDSRFPVRLAVKVEDVHGNPVAGAVVEFVAPSSGPSGRFAGGQSRTARATTDAQGVAVAPAFVAGAAQGGFVVRATVRGVAPAAFALVDEPAG